MLLRKGYMSNSLPRRFLAFWSEHQKQSGAWVGVYTGLILVGVVAAFARGSLFFLWALKASSKIHSAMLGAVLGSPLSFFHTNPTGRVLNRFAADQGIMDDQLPNTLFNSLQVRGRGVLGL